MAMSKIVTKGSLKVKELWSSPVGPKTVFFWAPAFKWGLIIANVADFSQPVENISVPQQTAVAVSGILWARYSTVINPKVWLLFANSIAMSSTGLYQLTRKMKHYNDSTKMEAIKSRYKKYRRED